MKDIIATLIIMLLCITALAQESASEDMMALLKPGIKRKSAKIVIRSYIVYTRNSRSRGITD